MTNDISEVTLNARKVNWEIRAANVLKMTIRFWFLVTLIGLFLFTYYIVAFYGGSVLSGNAELWSQGSLKGFVPGDLMGNIFFGAHMAFAVVISFGGIIQLIPQLRKRALQLHRINGRIFLITAFLISIGGLYLVWIRDSTTTTWGSVAVSFNALLIIYFGVKTWISARSHDVVAHRKWALRTFLASSGVWFFRIGFMAWIIVNQGPVGSTDNLDGPFDKFLAVANYLIPLGVLELYFYVSVNCGYKGKLMIAGLLFLLTLLMIVGIFGAFNFMWLPFISGSNDGYFEM